MNSIFNLHEGDAAMEIDQFEALEEKISKTVKFISDLQAEVDELKKYNNELINRVQEKEKIITQLLDEYQKLKEEKDQSEIYKQKEQKIQQKVEEIMLKLDSISSIDNKF
jgi:FtsZ-binding cell division protein ZapB